MREEIIGRARLILGDCREVLPTLPKVDLVCTDPPYGINIAANPVRQRHEKLSWDAETPTQETLGLCVAAGDKAVRLRR